MLYEFYSRWFGVIILAFTGVNAIWVKYRSRKLIEANPDLKEGFENIFWYVLISGGLPGLILTAGALTGGLQSIWQVLKPRDGNFYVIAFHFVMILQLIFLSYWVFQKNSIEFILNYWYPLRGAKSEISRPFFKFNLILGVLGGWIGLLLIWFN